MKIKFNSLELQSIDSDADSIIALHLEKLSRISDDIKILEEKLKKSAIPFTFIYIFSTKNKPILDASNYQDAIIYEEECLVWGKNINNDYRLLYNIYFIKEKTVRYGQTKNEDPCIPFLKQSKPLIEMKSHFRLKIEHELPFFYKSIINSLKLNLSEPKDYILIFSPLHFILESKINWDNFFNKDLQDIDTIADCNKKI